MKIGFFGSSYCSKLQNKHSENFNYKTFIQIIKNHYNAEITHYGANGCGSWDIILNQSKKLLDNPPDVAIFIWPVPAIIYHKEYQAIYDDSAYEGSKLHVKNPKLWEAVSLYYQRLYDKEKLIIEERAALMYADNTFIKELSNTTKVIHMWEWVEGDNIDFDLSNPDLVAAMRYPHSWNHGSSIITPLSMLSAAMQYPFRSNFKKVLRKDPRPNHLEGVFKNVLLASWIISVIDNPEKIVLDKTQETLKLFKESVTNPRFARDPTF